MLVLLPVGISPSQLSYKSTTGQNYVGAELDQDLNDLDSPVSLDESIDLQFDVPTDLESFYQFQFLKLIVAYPQLISVKRISFYLLDIPPPSA